MECTCDNLPAVTPQTQGVRNNPAGAANLPTIEQPDPLGLRRDSIPTTAQVAGDLPSAREAEKDAEAIDDQTRVFACSRLVFLLAHDGWNVTAEGEAQVQAYYEDGGYPEERQLFRGDCDCEPATLDLGFVGREELCESWGDRLAEVAEAELGRYHKVGRAATFAVLVQT